jgi:hypothetical protein
MNPLLAIMTEDNDRNITLIALQVVSVLGAGGFLFSSRVYPFALIPAIILLGMAVLLACYSRYRLFSLMLLGIFTSLILSLRFDYLVWGDPWFEYGMVQRILAYQSLDPSVYPAQFPVLHALIATCSLLGNIDPMILQKFVIPPISIIAIYAVYKLTEDISSSETAFFAGLLLISGTPYLHWTTQAVRETLGLALFILTLYVCIRAIRCERNGYLLLSLLLIGGLVLTHNLSMGIFLLVWLAISLIFLYLICDITKMRKNIFFSLVITITAVIFMLGWWNVKGGWEFSQFNGLVNTIFFSNLGIPLFLVSLIIIYVIPLVVPEKISSLRTLVMQVLQRKDTLYGVFIIGAVIGSIVVVNYILGKSGFSLSYPLPMLFNGICMVVFSLIGLYYFLQKDRFYVLAWIGVLSLALILSLSNIIQIEDRIRFIEFLYIPLSIVAAFGITYFAKMVKPSRLFPVIVTVFVLISILTAFPPVVFFGQSFEPGHPLYDNRSWVIQHQPTEISAISWLDTSKTNKVVETDAYVGYAARGVLLSDTLIQSEIPFMKDRVYSQHADADMQEYYLLILSRMTTYTEFGIQWLQKKEPLSDKDILIINNNCNILYTNGNANVYSYFSNVTSNYYYYNSMNIMTASTG